jgi:2-phosphosulfolactate phosphatase
MNIDAILTPAELPSLAGRNLRETVCVVFDVLRATSTFVTALHHGATAIIPVCEISEALVIRKKRPDVLLGGERDGLKISAAQTGGIDFDFGNSPREYTPGKVRGKIIVSTTTNGTRALHACAGAKMVLAGSFLNLGASATYLQQNHSENILLVCAGTRDNRADEDVLAAGALCELLACGDARPTFSASAETARRDCAQARSDLPEAVRHAENARRLLANSELRADVAFCLQRDVFPLIAKMEADGSIRCG